MSNSGQAYCYSPFTLRLIRVLDMDQDDVNHNGLPTLQGRLREISLDSLKPFDALSYVWGDDPSPLEEGKPVPNCILLDDEPGESSKPLKISKSCYIALQNLRDHHRVRTIWVDAICINQENYSEKNMQIPLMKEIYGKAEKVYIWLGKTKAFEKDGALYTSEDALEYLRQTSGGQYTLMGARLSGFPANMHPQQLARASRVLCEAVIAKWFPGPEVSSNHDSLKDLIGRKWFRRMWTIQELVMAEEPFVVCGRKSIRWNDFFWGLVLTWQRTRNGKKSDFEATITTLHGIESLWIEITKILEHRQSKHWAWIDKKRCYYSSWEYFLGAMEQYGKWILTFEVTVGFLLMLPRLFSRGMPINTLGHFFGPYQAFLFPIGALTSLLTPPERDTKWKENLQNILISVLHSCRGQEATNPKDKVYAIYGLLSSLEIKLPSPKYEDSHSLSEVYFKFAEAIIEWQGSLEILLDATGPWSSGPSGSAPSWVPNWSKPYKRLSFSNAKATGEQGSLGSGIPFRFSGDGRGIEVPGQEVGVVEYRLEIINGFRLLFWKHVDPFTRNRLVYEAFQELFDDIRAFYEWFQIATKVFALSKEEIAEFICSNLPQDATYTTEDVGKWIDLILDYQDESAGVHPGHKVLTMLLQNDKLFTVHWGICQFFAGSMTLFISKAVRFFLIGIGPGGIQRKDKVVLLSTLRAPIVVRVKGTTREFEVVGAALVDGMMAGQFWPTDNTSLENMLVV